MSVDSIFYHLTRLDPAQDCTRDSHFRGDFGKIWDAFGMVVITYKRYKDTKHVLPLLRERERGREEYSYN